MARRPNRPRKGNMSQIHDVLPDTEPQTPAEGFGSGGLAGRLKTFGNTTWMTLAMVVMMTGFVIGVMAMRADRAAYQQATSDRIESLERRIDHCEQHQEAVGMRQTATLDRLTDAVERLAKNGVR